MYVFLIQLQVIYKWLVNDELIYRLWFGVYKWLTSDVNIVLSKMLTNYRAGLNNLKN